MTLAHTSNNDICDSSTDGSGPEWHGLSPFGKQVVAEMNRVGMMCRRVARIEGVHDAGDGALHVAGDRLALEHDPRSRMVPRNMDDEMLAAIKKNNGVVQIVGFASYVKVQPPERDAAVRALNEDFFGPAPARGTGGGRGAGAAWWRWTRRLVGGRGNQLRLTHA